MLKTKVKGGITPTFHQPVQHPDYMAVAKSISIDRRKEKTVDIGHHWWKRFNGMAEIDRLYLEADAKVVWNTPLPNYTHTGRLYHTTMQKAGMNVVEC